MEVEQPVVRLARTIAAQSNRIRVEGKVWSIGRAF